MKLKKIFLPNIHKLPQDEVRELIKKTRESPKCINTVTYAKENIIIKSSFDITVKQCDSILLQIERVLYQGEQNVLELEEEIDKEVFHNEHLSRVNLDLDENIEVIII